MIVTVSGTVVDALGRPDNSPWTFKSVVVRESSDGEVITTKQRTISPSASSLIVKLESGPCEIGYAGQSYYVTIPESSPVDLWDLISAGAAVPPDTSTEILENAIGVYVHVAVPSTVTSPGVPGQIAGNATHIYYCIAANTWRRASLSTW